MRLPPLISAAAAAPDVWMQKKKGYDENWSSLIGIITAIVGNVLISFALNMQRYAHIRLERERVDMERRRKKRSASGTSLARLGEDAGKKRMRNGDEREPLLASDAGEEGECKQKSYLKSPYWWIGIVLMTVGEAGNFLAYGFAPASIVSPLGVVALISNCIIAPFMLKEPFRKRDALGVVIAVGGAVTVVLSASDNNPKLGPGSIWKLISTWEFETYLGVTVGLIAVLMVASNRYGEKNVLIDLGLVGLFGGYTALSTKGVASLLSYTLWRVITFPVFYLLLAILIGTAVMQIKYLNRALQHFDATQVIPVQFVLFTLSVILGSAVLYRDFERTSGDDAGKFVGGCAMTFLGVWFITTGRPRRNDDEEDDEEEDDGEEQDEAINLISDPHLDGTLEITQPLRRNSTIHSTPPTSTSIFASRPSTPHITLQSTSPPRPASSHILANPWASDSTPAFSRHISTPILPSEAAPPPPTATEPPRTLTRGKSSTEIPTTPGTSTPHLRRTRTGERVATLSRNSIAAGPVLASPLSTTLSAMVQDLKRSGNMRRGSAFGLEDGAMGEALGRRRTEEEERSRPGGRGRSLSGMAGELWRGLNGRGSREDIGIFGEGGGRTGL